MRTVSAAWESNQEETASDPSRLDGFFETRDDDGFTRWHVLNDAMFNNAVEATVNSIFDPTGTTIPLESCSLTVESETE